MNAFRCIAMSASLALASLITLLPASLHAADSNSVTVRGDVASVELVYTSAGAYVETILGVWVYDPTAAPQQPHLFRCNANAGGSLTYCQSPTAFLNCARTRTDRTDTYTGNQIQHYTCTPPARRDAGECIDLTAKGLTLDLNRYVIWSNAHGRPIDIQGLSLETQSVSFVSSGWGGSDCTVKP